MSIYDKSSLVLIPSGTKTGKVYSQKPVSGDGDFTFTRSSAATRVNADGNIEKETQNLFTYSNTFSDSSWLKADTSVTGGQAGYDGTNDAWLLEITGSTGFQTIRKQPISYSGVNTFSFYAKAGTLSWLRVNTSVANTYFDIGNGVVGSTDSSIGASIEAAGNGYYRCIVPVEGSSSVFYIYPASGDGNVSQSSGNLYIQDAQWEQGLVARDYIETTTAAVEGGITDNVPRLDYTDSSCPALLLEPQRTNELGNSEYLGGWTTSGVTLTSNYGTSPEGYTNSTRLQYVGSTGYIFLSTAILSGAETSSVYVKGTSGETIKFGRGGNVASGDMYTLTGEWQRLVFTRTDNTGGAFHISTYGGATARDIEVWGAQLELGSYATSYIPTYGSSVTRTQDKCYKTGVADLIGDNTTIFVEFVAQDQDSYCDIVAIDGGATSEIIELQQSSSNGLNAILYRGGFIANIPATSSLTTGTRYKAAFRIKTDDFAFYLNGVLQGTDTSGTYNGDSVRLNLSGYGASTFNNENAEISSCLLFNTALSNEELEDLTTL